MDHDAARSTAEQALEQLADEYGLTLLGLAVSLVGDHQAAEEVVQDALYRAYRHLERHRPVTRAWLSQAVIWRARAVRRQAWWRRVAVAQVPPPPTPDAEGAVVAAMRGLPRPLAEWRSCITGRGFTWTKWATCCTCPRAPSKAACIGLASC